MEETIEICPDFFFLKKFSTALTQSMTPKKFTTITFPYVRSLLLLAVLFRTIETVKIFDLVFILTNGGPGTATETIGVLVYRTAFQFFRTSNSAAMGYILLFAVIVLTSLYLYVIKQRESEEI